MIKRILLSLMIIVSTTQGYGFGEFFKVFSEAKSSVIEKFLERFLIKSEAEEKQEKDYENNFVEYNEKKLDQLYQQYWKDTNEEYRKNVCFKLLDTFPRLKDKDFLTIIDTKVMLRNMYQLIVEELENKESKYSIEIKRFLYSDIPDLSLISEFLTQKNKQDFSNFWENFCLIQMLRNCKKCGYIKSDEISND